MDDTFNLSPSSPYDSSYVGDMVYTEEQNKVRYVGDIAEMQGIPEDLTTEVKFKEVKDNNKRLKINPPLLTKQTKRPSLTDTEIALIHASYYNVPHYIIAHTLNISEEEIKRTYEQTKHHVLPSFPLLMITDTSRYWTEDEERVIYDNDSLNHIDDPLTHKELLRSFNEEQRQTDLKIFSSHLSYTAIEGNTIFPSTGLAGSIKLPEDIQEESFGLYGEPKHQIHTAVERTLTGYNLDTSINYHTNTYQYKMIFNKKFKYTQHSPYLLANDYVTSPFHIELANLLLKEYKLDITEEDAYKLPILLSSSPQVTLNVATSHLIKDIVTSPSPNHLHIYTTKLSFYKDYKESNLTTSLDYLTDTPTDYFDFKDSVDISLTTLVTASPYQSIRPPSYLRAYASPLKDTHGNFRYRFINPKHITDSHKEHTPKPTNLSYGIICHECYSLLSSDTHLTCPHIKLKINNFKNYLTKRKPLKEQLRTHTKYDYMYKPTEAHKTIYTIFLDTLSPPSYSIHYYHTLPSNSTPESLIDYIISISPNLLPLYTNISIPIHSTLQEPTQG